MNERRERGQNRRVPHIMPFSDLLVEYYGTPYRSRWERCIRWCRYLLESSGARAIREARERSQAKERCAQVFQEQIMQKSFVLGRISKEDSWPDSAVTVPSKISKERK